MVLNQEAEIGLARSLNHPEIETLSLRDDPLLLVGHPKHGPTRARRARLEEVANWPLVFYERGSSDWTLTHGLFRRAGLVPNVALEVDTIETAKRMVDRGLGMAFLPQLAVGQELRSGKLATVKLLDAEPLGRSLDIIHSRHRPLRKEAQAFLQVIRKRSRNPLQSREAHGEMSPAHDCAEPAMQTLFPQLSTTRSTTSQDVHRHTGFGTCAKCIRRVQSLKQGKEPRS